MTRNAAGWRQIVARYQQKVEQAEAAAERYDAIARKHELMEDSLVADTYAEARARATADAEWWRNKRELAAVYADDAELPVTLTLVTEASA